MQFPVIIGVSDGKPFTITSYLGNGNTTCILLLENGNALRVTIGDPHVPGGASNRYVETWIKGHAKITGHGLRVPKLYAADTQFFEYAEVENTPVKFTGYDVYAYLNMNKNSPLYQLFLQERRLEVERLEQVLNDPEQRKFLEGKYDEFVRSSGYFEEISDATPINFGWTGKEWFLFDWVDMVSPATDVRSPGMRFPQMTTSLDWLVWERRVRHLILSGRIERCRKILSP